ncbi:MAG TPA: aspartate-semialdehyde dehydrogenase [Capsulimonadaceae bacterium]|jgi:aspartate-semialdehyde dehydrogenase
MSLYEVAVVGVGAVGEEMLRVLAEHKFPAKHIRVLARTERTIAVDGREYKVEGTSAESFDGVDIALFAGTEGEKGAAVTFGDEAVKRGAIVIDNGADFRMRDDVPLVVPEVNGEALRGHKGIIANPNCSTAQLVMALKPLHDFGKLTRVLISTYQAVSGAGSGGIKDLDAQNKALVEGTPLPEAKSFSTQVAANIIPQIGGFDEFGYTSEEMKLVHETHKILGDNTIKVTPMITARVPVAIGHSEAVYVETERPITPDQARELWNNFPGVTVLDDIRGGDVAKAWPTPLTSAGKDDTFIGRVRQDVTNPNGLVFWVVADNLRKGAAGNAVQIAEKLVELGLVGKK